MATENEVTREELIAQNAELTARAEGAEAELAEAQELIAELTEKLENADAAQAESPVKVLSHEGEQYRLLLPKIQHQGQVYTAADLAKAENAGVVKELIGDGQGPLQKVEKAKKPAAPKK